MFRDYFSLLDPDHGFLLFIAVLIGGLIPAKEVTFNLLVAGFSAAFIGMSAFIVNDLFDLKADKINKRKDKPLVTGRISTDMAWLLFALLLLIGVFLSFTISTECVFIALLFVFLSITYAIGLKAVPFVGNILIASSMAVPFIYGSLAVNTLHPAVLWLSLLAFLMGVGREIIGSIRDMEGDKKQGRKTLPIIIGLKKSSVIAVFFMLSAVVFSFFPFFLVKEYYFDFYYLSFVILTDLLLLFSIIKALSLKNFTIIRKLTLLAQFTGLTAFLLGVVF